MIPDAFRCPKCYGRRFDEGEIAGHYSCVACGHEFEQDDVDWQMEAGLAEEAFGPGDDDDEPLVIEDL